MMEILAGELGVLLPDAEYWEIFKAGDTFEVPAKTVCKVNLKEAVDYCCSYF